MGSKKSSYYRLMLLVIVPVVMSFISPAVAQRETLSYKVVQNSKNIGWIKLQKVDSAGNSRIHLQSEIKKRIIFLLSVIERQNVSFTNGLMMESHIYRKVNKDVKMNKRTSYAGTFYEVKDQESAERLNIKRIQYNLLSMYFREPVNITKVYSDTFSCLLNIEDKGNSSYKISLPDGNTNYYFYKNGICSRIRLEHSLFTIEFIRI